MMLIDPVDIHSAADTWSGFIYQGKVALYHVLRLIHEEPNIDPLWLQLDSLEDFAIIRYDLAGLVVPVSLHQVKAVKDNSYGRYADDFKKLEKRKKDFPCEKEAYFHMASDNKKSPAEIEALHPDLKIYLYDADPYCPIALIQDKINAKISDCLRKLGLELYAENANYIADLGNILEEMITSQILAVHANNHEANGLKINEGAYHFTIPLVNFTDELLKDFNTRIFDKDYYRKVLRLDLNRYYQDYCIENEEELDQDAKDKLARYLVYFNNLDDLSFEKFLQNIMPHKVVGFTTLQQYKDHSLHSDEFKGAFIYMLSEIRDSDKDVIHKLGWVCKNNKRFFPSTINTPDTDRRKKNLCAQIIETALSTSVATPFNCDYIITEVCNADSLEEEAVHIFRVHNVNHDNITQWRKLALIDAQKAKKEINE